MNNTITLTTHKHGDVVTVTLLSTVLRAGGGGDGGIFFNVDVIICCVLVFDCFYVIYFQD